MNGSGRRWLIALGGLVASLQGLPASAQERAEEYQQQWAVRTETLAPYYRVRLPLAVYLAARDASLPDLRVFNAAGQVMPMARIAAPDELAQQERKQALPWFPLSQPASGRPDDALQVQVRQQSDGSLVDIRSNAARQPGRTLRGYLLDASSLRDARGERSLELDWAGAEDGFQSVDVEGSDDLQHWQRLASGASLARFDHQGASIRQQRIELNGPAQRYLRVIWRNPEQAPRLSRAELGFSEAVRSAALSWSDTPSTLSADPSHPQEYHLQLPQALPLARLRVLIPAGNQVLPLEVLAAEGERRNWRRLASEVVYRLDNQGQAWSRQEITLPGQSLRTLVLRLDARVQPPPSLQVDYALRPAELLFLAGGDGPYRLAAGHPQAKSSSLAPATLIPAYGQPGGPQIADASLQALPRDIARPGSPSEPGAAPPKDWSKPALWGALILGVLLMAGMAWQITRQMKQAGAAKSTEGTDSSKQA